MVKNPDISVIIPVYNTKKLLFSEMIRSVEKQCGVCFEVIIINDGSNNETSEFLEEIQNSYQNITVISQENCGVSKARNTGIKSAHGKYITFVDADDYIADSFFLDAFHIAEENNADIVYGSMELVPQEDTWLQKPLFDRMDIVDDMDSVKTALLQYRYGELPYVILGTPCARLIKRSLLQTIQFDENIHYFEDQIFNRELLNIAKKVVISPNVWYYYVQNEVSAMHKVKGNIDYYKNIKGYWDRLYALNQKESERIKLVSHYHAYNEYIGLVVMGFIYAEAPIYKILQQMREAAKHPLIEQMRLCKEWNKMSIRFGDRVVLFLIRQKWFLLLFILLKLYFNKKAKEL